MFEAPNANTSTKVLDRTTEAQTYTEMHAKAILLIARNQINGLPEDEYNTSYRIQKHLEALIQILKEGRELPRLVVR